MNGWCEYELKEIDDINERALICGVAEGDVRKNVKAIVLKNRYQNQKSMQKKF